MGKNMYGRPKSFKRHKINVLFKDTLIINGRYFFEKGVQSSPPPKKKTQTNMTEFVLAFPPLVSPL